MVLKIFLNSPRKTLLAALLLSVGALATAYTSQIAFGLAPCILCLYQRVPYAIIIGISAIALMARKTIIARAGLLLNALSFAANSAIALYHSGVERHWWKSAFEGCSVSFDTQTGSSSLLDTIMKTKPARCDEIAWADPLLGLSMANYNAAICALAAILLLIVFIKQSRKRSAQP